MLSLKADIMSSELTYVIVKPCGLSMAVGAQKELTVGHDDKMTELPNSIARADVPSQACARKILHSGDPRTHAPNDASGGKGTVIYASWKTVVAES